MIALLMLSVAVAQDAPDLDMDDDLLGFLKEQAAAWPDRTKKPAIAAADPWELPEWTEHQLSPEVRVLHVPVEGVRKVELMVVRGRGSLDFDGEHTMAAYASGWLMDAGTVTMTAEDLEVATDLIDMGLWSDGVGFHRSELGFDVPREDFGAALELFADVVKNPAYPKADIKRWSRDRLLDWQVFMPSNPNAVAGRALDGAWFSPDSVYGKRIDLKEFKAVKTANLIERNLQMNAEAPFTIRVVGDVSWEELEPELTAAFAGLGAEGEEKPAEPFTAPTEGRNLAIHVPGANQAIVRMRMAAPPVGHADEDVLAAVNWAYGGAFMSRLNRSIREEKGWTYGGGSRYASRDAYGTFTVSYDTGADTTADAIAETTRLLDVLASEGCTAEEIDASYRESVGYWNDTNVDAGSAAGFYEWLYDDGLTVAQARERLLASGAFTPEQTAKAAATWLGPEQPRVWVVVGDRSKLEPELEELGWTWEWIDADDAVLGTF